ncbi:TIGR01457 family HAD-type hydrolase [Halobacillus litoralis]|uniref:TIGR01457 family HAD-type hydrolase n=1 Tax=Halobacillus litoralis TaxID=45668 RepID=UPI001CD1E4F6|nr:TIGR01457 family HAD-type hydrolase [Halobacillus litoralis]MCA0971771.1 TIGR01457 family HAD-type hydrolase [Halobacillus litoralis]
MKAYKGYLIDLDGTMYRGTEKIEGADSFVHHLEANGFPYLFLTNNSAKTAGQVVEKLTRLGIPATEDHIFTSSMATASYISDLKNQAKVFVIGEHGLIDALQKEGHQIVEDDADYVIIGLDRDISYEKLTKACLNVRNGAKLISTNRDVAIPTERGMMPGNGAITSVVSVSTGVSPIFVGKPSSIIMDQALERIGFSKEEVVMVGDNYDTDIMSGISAGIDTLMVETGVSTFDGISDRPKQPTYQYKNLMDVIKEEGS